MPPPSVSICLKTETSRSSPPLSHWSTTLATVFAPVALLVTCSTKPLLCSVVWVFVCERLYTIIYTYTYICIHIPGGSGHRRAGRVPQQGHRMLSSHSAAATPTACQHPTWHRMCSPSACPSWCAQGCKGWTSLRRCVPPGPSPHHRRQRTWPLPRGWGVTPLRQSPLLLCPLCYSDTARVYLDLVSRCECVFMSRVHGPIYRG